MERFFGSLKSEWPQGGKPRKKQLMRRPEERHFILVCKQALQAAGMPTRTLSLIEYRSGMLTLVSHSIVKDGAQPWFDTS